MQGFLHLSIPLYCLLSLKTILLRYCMVRISTNFFNQSSKKGVFWCDYAPKTAKNV